jgi:multiple antibiotic resistance protein
MNLAVEILRDLVPVFVIVSPIGVVPLFLGMTRDDPPERRHRTAWIAALTTTITLLAACLAGQALFRFFAVDVDAFRIAGGILLFIIALDFVQVRQTRLKTTDPEYEEGVAKNEVGIIPLAIPMLSGPGAVATVMVLRGERGGDLLATIPLLAAILLVGAATLAVLLAAVRLQRWLTASTLGILLRLEGLLLAAIAVQMVVTGVTNLVVATYSSLGR